MSASGCSKKEEASPAPNTGSFQLDGTAISCQAKATRSAGSIGGTFYDFLDLDLTPTPAAGGVGRLRLSLYKVPGSPASTYLLHNLLVYTGCNGSPYNFAGTSFTLTPAGEGSFSGRFAGKVSASSSSIPGPYTTITNGVFTTVPF
ncbi:hypothetical protein AUC43_11705 [Hymenobacter sedentarius]|uniref:Uncharacterized protein n=1 Tax=Hymenobacter sedentarius TaxID=1411621 RepID=A0A0U4AY60_9BACT|nr:hypothetical protein [Hymenobacter sedentarius]ALW85693.1 hypothetical protein AUC43_11705 [Hymenobacter sedentarius]